MEQTNGLINNLVTQFASAFDCFRELVQNSIDAGSPRIEIWTEFEVGEDHLGTIRITVEDMGEGMDEGLIDGQLTRLFASSKENDLTKIGKFGIGFVSVFALQPEAVLVHTGRSGEYWEVLFHADRTYTKTRIDSPVEGTTVTLFLTGDYHRYREVVQKTYESLRQWCSHARVEITFEDRVPPPGQRTDVLPINSPFEEIDAECAVVHEEVGTRLVCGYSLDPHYAFFNSGLTLAQTRAAEEVFNYALAERLKCISLKVDSRYLEHTLSRDTVMRDENWERACEIVRTAVDTLLPVRLMDEIEGLVAQPEWSLQTMQRYAQLVGFLAFEDNDSIRDVLQRRVLRDVNGRGWTPEEIWRAYRADGRVLLAEAPSELTERLAVLGHPVLLGKWAGRRVSMWSDHPLTAVPLMVARCVGMRIGETFWGTIKRFFSVNLSEEVEHALTDPQLVYLPVVVDDAPPPAAEALVAHAARLLNEIGAGYEQVSTFVASAGARNSPFFVTGREFAEVMARPPRSLDGRSHAAVNREHPHFVRLMAQYESRPQLAAYCLAKALLLNEDRLLDKDLDLMNASRSG